jgi:tRNA(Ile)-lysidine synthase TilS/MesJ
MIQKADRILVCVSGGKHSLTLLYVLLHIKRKIPFKIEIGYIQLIQCQKILIQNL